MLKDQIADQLVYSTVRIVCKNESKMSRGQSEPSPCPMGSTGASTGNHLHFEVRQDGVAVNPKWH